ncbi:MAG TPA: hypothetical protein VJT10_23010, partial [Steroidobacteraceae bacterium]|nr:hypothetical protein [Steroidobacteraceae bacterium]
MKPGCVGIALPHFDRPGVRNRWGTTLRATRYGEVLSPDSAATFASVAAGTVPNDITLGAKTLVDLEGRFNIT